MIELKLIDTYPLEIIAVDEVGRGPLSGPVVIGAVRIVVNSKAELQAALKHLRGRGIKDSKKLLPDDRLKVLKKIGILPLNYRERGVLTVKDVEVSYVTWEMDHVVIDRENILGASLLGMKEAALFLSALKNHNTTVLIDGNQKLRWGKEASPFNEVPIVKGDSRSVLIGLASMIAKEKRDTHMREMHDLYPHYGFANHFGYPTKEHREAIKVHGPSPIHRKTFKGVREFVQG